MTELFSEVQGDRREVWVRRAVVGVFAAIAALALWGAIGQRETEWTASGPSARLLLAAPETVRGGIYFQSYVEIRATAAVEHPRLVLDDGWLEGMQVNSIEPAAESETSRDGRLVLSYGGLDPGDVLRIWMQFQVDPTSTGRRDYGLELDDEDRPLARIDRTIRVLP